jgi:methyl-accepting chemotaxis protein
MSVQKNVLTKGFFMLNNIKIGPKLIGGFLVVSLITLAIGILGIINLQKLDSMVNEMYCNHLLGISDVKQANINLVNIGKAVRQTVAARTEEERDGFFNNLQKCHITFCEYMEKVDKVLLTDESRKKQKDVISSEEALMAGIKEYQMFLNTQPLLKLNNTILNKIDSMRAMFNETDANLNSLSKMMEGYGEKMNKESRQVYIEMRTLLIFLVLFGTIIGILLGLFLSRSISIPLNSVVTMIQEMAIGHLGVRLQLHREDEIGTMAKAMDDFSDDLQKNVVGTMKKIAEGDLNITVETKDNKDEIGPALKQTVEALRGLIIEDGGVVLQAAATKDLTMRLQRDYRGAYLRMKENINVLVENLDQALQQVAQGTRQVSSASLQISSGSQSLAQGANEQASSLEEVSSSLEQMASMTKQNANNSINAKNLATSANSNAEQGKQAMTRMTISINKIKESSDQTARIVKTIDEIAMQTNLLALNAAVEAARAGEAGRGFAVVAEEVRNLAQRSAEAAKNTANMIEESVRNAVDGVTIASEVARSFDEITDSNAKVNNLITEIAAASQEQSQGIEQINIAVTQMDKVTQQNAANSEESASAAEELSSQSEELQQMVNMFKLTDEDYQLLGNNPDRLSTVKSRQTFSADPSRKFGQQHLLKNSTPAGCKQDNEIFAVQEIPFESNDQLKEF